MKIGILTHYDVSSHGALLQMYGLQSALQKMGHEVVILTYTKNFDFIDEKTKKRFSANIKNLSYYISTYVREDGIGTLIYQYNKQKTLRNFRNKHFKFVPYTCSGELDLVVVGADEVFALENGINMVMFGHGISSKKIISYAPSMGQTDIERIERFGFSELIESGLKKFSTLSARDVGTQNNIEIITGKKAPIVCDPALLYSFEHPVKKNRSRKYIVVYSYQSNFKEKDRIRYIQDYAKKSNCELWSVGVYYRWCNKKINCTPLDMIEIFSGAEAVITDTFHGTITSYIAHTPMAIFVRKNNKVKLDHLLNLIGIQNREVQYPEQLESVINQPIDFNKLDKNVNELRQKGNNYLVDALKK